MYRFCVERHTNLTEIIMWSDGFAAQFRSRFVFKLLANYRRDLQVEWNYNEAHHGKGPMDGIGEAVKNVVFIQVKSGRVIINSAEEFSVTANKFVPSIATQFQKEKDWLACSASQMALTSHPLFQQPSKYINLFGQVQPSVVQLLIFISSQMEKNPAILIHIRKGNVVTWVWSMNL